MTASSHLVQAISFILALQPAHMDTVGFLHEALLVLQTGSQLHPCNHCTGADLAGNHGSEATPCAESFDTILSIWYQEAEISFAKQIEACHVPPLARLQYLKIFELMKLYFQNFALI